MRKLVNTVLAGALGLSMIAGVSAQDATINVEINDDTGAVTPLITRAPNFGTVDYSLGAQSAFAAVDEDLLVTVTDNRGGSTGWSIDISGLDFVGESTGETFEVSNLTLGEGAVTAPEFGVADNVDAFGNYQVSNDAQGLLLADADAGSNGVFIVTYNGSELNVPAGTPVDTYNSTLTVTVGAGPTDPPVVD